MNDVEAEFSAGYIAQREWVASHLARYVSEDEWKALIDQVRRLAEDLRPHALARVFTAVPRVVTSVDRDLRITLDPMKSESDDRLPLLVNDWPLVRLIRVWVLMHIPPLETSAYVSLIEQLFTYGDVEELAALYAALPVYHHPSAWRSRCTEGIRSNMGPVRHAVMVRNAYPSRFLEEGEWNQLVLKAFFTGEDIPHIIGLKARNNARLAQALVDYAYELHAAKRPINPLLWLLVAPFLDDRAYQLMQRIVRQSEQPLEQKAIAYAFRSSGFAPANAFLEEHSELTELLNAADIPWGDWQALTN